MVLLTSGSATAQLLTVLLLFVAILAVVWVVTKWLANYQKLQNANRSVEVIETTQIVGPPNAKWIQVVRIGKTYKAIAVAKDQVTYLGDIDPEQIVWKQEASTGAASPFAALLARALRKEKEPEEPEAPEGGMDTDAP